MIHDRPDEPFPPPTSHYSPAPIAHVTLNMDGNEVLHNDLAELMVLVGLDPTLARPASPHDVFQMCLAILRLQIEGYKRREAAIRTLLEP